jgi:hypothetical protein
MNDKYYKLIRGRLHRVDATVPQGYKVFEPGDIIVPTDTELRSYRENFEGPMEPGAVTESGEKSEAQTLADQADSDLQMGLPSIRDTVRKASLEYLDALLTAEGRHQPAPRSQVLDMITRRLKKVPQPA